MKITIIKELILESYYLEESDRPIGSGFSKKIVEDKENRDRLASQIRDSRAQSSMFHDHMVTDKPGYTHHNNVMQNYKNYHNNFASLLSQKNGAVPHIDTIQRTNPEHADKVLNTLGAKPRLIPSYNSTDNSQIRSRINAGIEPIKKSGSEPIYQPKKQA